MERTDAGALGREALAYADTLHNLARYLTRNDTDAEDLVQETYARALKSAAQFTRGTNLKAWLFTILRNTYVTAYRRQRVNPVVGGLDEDTPLTNDTWMRDDFEVAQLRKLVAGEIEQALLSLSDDARTIILLDLEGLSEVETAQVVGVPVGTVKSRLSRARAALRRRLKDYAR